MWMNTQIVALNTTDNFYFTPWFPKRADNAIFALEKILDSITPGAGSFTVTVWTKNIEDEGSNPGTLVGTFTVLNGNFWEAACANLKGQVRFRIYFKTATIGQGVIYRFLPVTWYDTAV
jgi:hypothetical protein